MTSLRRMTLDILSKKFDWYFLDQGNIEWGNIFRLGQYFGESWIGEDIRLSSGVIADLEKEMLVAEEKI